MRDFVELAATCCDIFGRSRAARTKLVRTSSSFGRHLAMGGKAGGGGGGGSGLGSRQNSGAASLGDSSRGGAED